MVASVGFYTRSLALVADAFHYVLPFDFSGRRALFADWDIAE